MLYELATFLLLSVLLNAYLVYKLKKSPVRTLSVDAKTLLSELMSGGATVSVKVLDAEGLFYRSPKG